MMIKKIIIGLYLVFLWGVALFAQSSASPIPYLAKKGSATQLIVDNKPFLMIAGELHNSSSSTVEYMQPIYGGQKDLCKLRRPQKRA